MHPGKCKELRISFAKQPPSFDPLIVDGNELEVVTSAKLLGITISNDLSWNEHIHSVIKKVNKRIYFLIQLKRAKVPPKDLSLFYVTFIRSVIDYGIVSFLNSLPKYLKNEFSRIEKRVISIILPDCNYITGLDRLGLINIEEYHNNICKIFLSIENNENHKLRHLLPKEKERKKERKNRKYEAPFVRTNRAKNSFILSMCG